ncbi:putative heterokaryon incompatibility protein [Rosellinia necatrix]|uniref:Putative heterokaryon incompatibility protein n=1 Tax=Rosellinia necatrix TaxID=77044 RepID=A0A1W2TQR6_ROSNE|nr:putative heterokaryon incompatibility protein [Rosellinia necatrix]
MNPIHGISRWAKEELFSRKQGIEDVFVHSRLDDTPGTLAIRLVSLENDSRGSILRCTLRDIDLAAITALNGSPTSRYEAVSYSWRKDMLNNHELLSDLFPDRYSEYGKQGADEDMKLLLCNGKAMKIHMNLYEFLVRIRAQKRGLPLWIDAICIDQNEDDPVVRKEKLRQLGIMGKIYESAEAVLVWLGETGNVRYTFEKTIDYVLQMPAEYEPYDTEFDIWKVHKRKAPLRIVRYLDGSDIMSLARLVNRDYFQRSWVIQEIVLARRLIFYLGGIEISPDKLLGIICTMSACDLVPHTTAVSPAEVGGSGFRAIPHMMRVQTDPKRHAVWSFRDYLFLCRDRQASRAEDKVFALLGLVDAEMRERLTRGAIAIDGKTNLHKLYANCAVILAKEKGWSYTLSLVACGAAETPDLPSWVPDLRVPLKPKPFWYYGCTHFHAARSVSGEFILTKDTSDDLVSPEQIPSSHALNFGATLTLRIARVDEIVQVGESGTEILPTQIKYARGHIFDLVTNLGRYYAGTSELSMDAVMRTFIADIFERDHKIPLPNLRRAFVKWFATLASNISFEPSKTRPEDSFFRNTAKGRLAVQIHNTTVINGTDIQDVDTAVRQFIEMHDSPEFPFYRQLTSGGAVSSANNAGKADVIIPGEELVGVDITDSMDEQLNRRMGDDKKKGKDRRKRLVTEWEAHDPRLFWQYQEQQIGSVSWVANELFRNRRVFRTKDRNLVGMGPQDLRRGDVVCLVAGTDVPFIFRKHADPHTREPDAPDDGVLKNVKLVGHAYLHGVMYGEFIRNDDCEFNPSKVW